VFSAAVGATPRQAPSGSGAGTRASLLLYLEPLVSVAGAVALLGERLSASLAAGGALVLGGIAATWTPGPRDKDPPEHRHPGSLGAGREARGR
jgi:hypothetical protein